MAKEQLQIAETAGILCRDDTLGGVFYFRDRFDEFVSTYLD